MTALAFVPTYPWKVCGTDQELRDCIQEFDTRMQAIGLVKTADTGQFDYATLALTLGANAASVVYLPGYLMYRFNDALQSTLPIFIKIRFGAIGSTRANLAPVHAVSIGTGTNGAGTLTGKFTTEHLNNYGYSGTGQFFSSSSRICYDQTTGFFGVIYNPGTYYGTSKATAAAAFFISRSQDSTGAPTDEQVSLWSREDGTSSASNDTYVNWSGLSQSTYSKDSTVIRKTTSSMPTVASADNSGSDVNLQRTYSSGSKLLNCYNLLTYSTTALATFDEFDVVSGGTLPSHFCAIGDSSGMRPSVLPSTQSFSIAMRFQ